MEKLKFGKGNAKLDKKIHTFSLPAGHTCPFAFDCKASADRITGKITDGDNQLFRCFAASQEALYKTARESRWHNYDLLKELKSSRQMADLIIESMPKNAKKVRVHVSGDFFNQTYFDAWLIVCNALPHIIFYAYTKSVKYWANRISLVPKNFILTASKGGRTDDIASLYGFKTAEVVLSTEDAVAKGLEIDHDDSHAYSGDSSFALLIHGTQKKGSKASDALKVLKKKGIKGYSKKK